MDNTLNIAMDLTQVPANKTGIGIFALNLVRRITAMDHSQTGLRFFFFGQDDDPQWQQMIEGNPYCRFITINHKRYRKLWRRFLFEQLLLPRQCKTLGIDWLYSFHYTMPYFTHLQRMVTIPDMTFYLMPRHHQLFKRIYFKTLIPFSLRRSKSIVTISQSAADDMTRRFSFLDAAKLSVIHLGVNEPGPIQESAEEKQLQHLGLQSRKYFLFIGTLEPRKNIISIIKAFHHLNENKGYRLVIAGGKGWFYQTIFQTVHQLGLEEQILFTGYVDDLLKQTLLKHAYLFVYPSFYEGFGLPVLEAMIHGVPVITSNISSLPEVAGDAALLINPDQWQQITAAMETLIKDRELYKQLMDKSRARAMEFTWQRTTDQILALFRETQS